MDPATPQSPVGVAVAEAVMATNCMGTAGFGPRKGRTRGKFAPSSFDASGVAKANGAITKGGADSVDVSAAEDNWHPTSAQVVDSIKFVRDAGDGYLDAGSRCNPVQKVAAALCLKMGVKEVRLQHQVSLVLKTVAIRFQASLVLRAPVRLVLQVADVVKIKVAEFFARWRKWGFVKKIDFVQEQLEEALDNWDDRNEGITVEDVLML
jgi:hypothetical protein